MAKTTPDRKFGYPPVYPRPRDDTSRLRDQTKALRPGVTDEHIDGLVRMFIDSRLRRGVSRPLSRMSGFAPWLNRACGIRVDLKPGRAVLRASNAGYRVEIQFVQSGKDKRGKPILKPTAAHVIADDGLTGFEPADISVYFAALMLRVAQGGVDQFTKAPPQRPAPGKPLDVDFYRQLIASHEQLVLANCRNPAKELAERMGENHATVRSWIRRGRAYLAPQRKE